MLHLDFETRSIIDLPKCGAYVYAAHPSTDVTCLGWAVGDDEPAIWYPHQPVPVDLILAVKSGIKLVAWNANFERLIWNNVFVRYGVKPLPIEQFYCVAANARSRGYPGKLEVAARFAGINSQKDMGGHALMMKLCRPRKIEADGTIIWWDDPVDHERQGEYCIQDVKVERAMYYSMMPLNDMELARYHLSEKINDRGICADVALAKAAVEGIDKEKITATDMLRSLTKSAEFPNGEVETPSQVQRILTWVEKNWKPLPDLSKATVQDALLEDDIPPDVQDVLEIRLEQARAAVSKFEAIIRRSGTDGIVRGLFMYHGAGTGRFTSTGVQIHNLVRKSSPELIPVLMKRGIPGLKAFGDPVHMLAQMVRPAFMASPGHILMPGDFAQIEARITAWLAGEEVLLEAFRDNKRDAYCEFGTDAWGRLITKADELERNASKHCVLGLGFGGGIGALARSLKSQANIVLPDETLHHLHGTYRERHRKIKKLWYQLRDAVLLATLEKGTEVEVCGGRVVFLHDGEHLYCRLPSGRLLTYPFARIVVDDFGDAVEYKRGNRRPKQGATEWPTTRLWYGLVMENLAQAIAYDLLMGAMFRLEAAGFPIRIHVHDEAVPEVRIAPNNKEQLGQMLGLMSAGEDWTDGLPIKAEGKLMERYGK